jgi:hypothetical protein
MLTYWCLKSPGEEKRFSSNEITKLWSGLNNPFPEDKGFLSVDQANGLSVFL